MLLHEKNELDLMEEISLVMEVYELVNISKRRAFWSLNEDNLKIIDSDYQYAVSIKEDMAYSCLHSSKTTRKQAQYVVNLYNSTSNHLIPLDSWTSELLVYKESLSIRMTKVIKGEYEIIKDVKVEDVLLTCDTPLEVFNNEVSLLSRMDDDSEHEVDSCPIRRIRSAQYAVSTGQNRGDLMPIIEEGEVIEEFRNRDVDLDTGIDDYPSYCDYDKKIHINCAHNLKFSYMIGFKFTHANFFLLLSVNVMSKKFYNSIMKDKMVYKGDTVVGALTNVPIFVGYLYVVTDFVVLKNMDAYRDEGMGDVIVGEPFLREVGIKAKWFEGTITLYKDDKV
uniref:Uncharacterized protein n=1 Tax=Tanacetum cinerariifolium TaxID=118510 RepID=A0A6L2MDF2_TANCI|nr:hypothetical protein [Tanacetum cinerariifolium]